MLNLKKLIEWGFEPDEKLKDFLDKSEAKTAKLISSGIKGLKGKLYPFQVLGVDFIERNNGRVLLADEMGLGKTIQSLSWLQMHPELRPVIVVVPASLKLQWEREANEWMTNPNVEVLSGTVPYKSSRDILILNYDVLWEWLPSLKKLNPKVFITDECHYYKNNSAKRTKAVKSLGKAIPHMIALSGTPIVNRPYEASNAVFLIKPDMFKDVWYYYVRYCKAKHTRFGWDFNGTSHTQELHEKLKIIMLRRLKKDVLKELPDKTYSFVPMELENMEEYKYAEKNFVSFIRDTKGSEAADRANNAVTLTKIESLKQLAVKGKLSQIIRWVQNFLEINDKLVIFATHKFAIDALMKAFPDISVKVDGSVSQMERQGAVDHFQNDPNIHLFVGNIKASGVGITLTASSNVAFVELPWTPGDLVQAIDRCHRIGQKDNVTVHYLLASGTIEEKIAQIIDEKRKIFDAVIDGKETEEKSLLTELIKTYAA